MVQMNNAKLNEFLVDQEIDFSETEYELLIQEKDTNSIGKYSSFLNVLKKVIQLQNDNDFIDLSYIRFPDIKLSDLDINHTKKIHFNEAIFYGKVNFSNVDVENELDFTEAKFLKPIDFSNTTFKMKIEFSRAILEDGSNFSETTFNSEVLFKDTVFKSYVKFSNTRFRNIFYSENATFLGNVDFSDTTFEENCFFTNSHFGGKAKFSGINFHEVAYFRESVFENKAYFNNCKFYKNADFSSVIFKQDTTFMQAEFANIVSFAHSKSNEIIDLSNISFNKIELRGSRFADVDYLDMMGRDQKNNPENLHSKHFANKESARQIKAYLEKQNNITEANKYFVFEQELFLKELKQKNFWNNKGIIISVWLHKIISNSGTSWLRVLAWIIIFGVLALITNVLLHKLDIFAYWKTLTFVGAIDEIVHLINPFKQGDEIFEGHAIFATVLRIISLYLLWQFAMSFRQNTRRK